MHGDYDAPQLHGDHPRPVTRRQLLAQGFMTGAAYTVGWHGVLSLFAANPRLKRCSYLSPDLDGQLGPDNILRVSQRMARARSRLSASISPVARTSSTRTCWCGQEGGQRLALDSGLREDGPAGRHGCRDSIDPNVLQQDLRELRPRAGFPLDSAFRRGILQSLTPGNERSSTARPDSGAFGQRHGQQPAQPDVRHRACWRVRRCDGSILTLCRFREHRFRW